MQVRRGAAKRVEDLEVFQLAFQISLQIHEQTMLFPKTEQFELARQMRRASKSVCANLAEGFGKQAHSPAEFGRFLSIAIGSSDEMQTWALYAVKLKYIDESTYERWCGTYRRISRMLQRLRASKTYPDHRSQITDHQKLQPIE